MDRNSWKQQSNNPFDFDTRVAQEISQDYDIVHFNGNPWRETLKTLRYFNPEIKVVSSVPAHNLKASIFEHKRLGIPHERLYPHLHQWDLWKQYIEHINESCLVITPSHMSETWLRELPFIREDIVVKTIPHGVNLPQSIPPKPERFTPAYFGANGADKGVQLIPDDVVKYGRDFGNDYPNLDWLMERISIGVFPAVTEAFNVCALECLSYGRPIAVSTTTGIAELVPTLSETGYPSGVIRMLQDEKMYEHYSRLCRKVAEQHTWDKIEKQYEAVYNEL